jgi:potassium-transporting ATPase KdpC subunit
MTVKAQLRPALVMFGLLVVLTGMIYPAVTTGIAQVAMPGPANGSLVIGSGGTLIGSSLIGQNFTDPRYFWGRPSATAGAPYTAYDAQALTGSSGSNVGPLSADLRKAVEDRIAALRAADPGNAAPIPADLVTASASGLDPSISVAAALYQAPRVARLRGIDGATVQSLIGQQTQGRWLGVFGEPRVSVLALNQALDNLQQGVE